MGAGAGHKNAVGNAGGRPSKFKAEFVEQAFKLALLGATDKEMASFFQVAESVLNRWKKIELEFSESLKKGKLMADGNIASRLYQRANGYQYDEVTFEKYDTRDLLEETQPEQIKQGDTYRKKVVTKEVAPDVTAQIFWLKNRQKDKWRDRQDLNSTLEINRMLENMTDADLEKLSEKLIAIHTRSSKDQLNKPHKSNSHE